MPEYVLTDEAGRQRNFQRKHFYMPCALVARFDALPESEQVRYYRETKWADNLSAKEWEALLADDGAAPMAYDQRYNVTRKAAGWLVMLARLHLLRPEVFAAAAEQAEAWYLDQAENPYPLPLLQADERLVRLEQPMVLEEAGAEVTALLVRDKPDTA